MTDLKGRALTTCDVTVADGAARLQFVDAAGQQGSLELSAESAIGFSMTLPGLTQQALQARSRDASLRILSRHMLSKHVFSKLGVVPTHGAGLAPGISQVHF